MVKNSCRKKESPKISKLLEERRQFVRKLARNPDMEEVRVNICCIEQQIGSEVIDKTDI